MLSVILPAFNEEASVPLAADRITGILAEAGIENELVFIDDGSGDGTWAEIGKAMRSRDNIVGVRFSRNFGKEAAIFAGLEAAAGDCCVVMDCDLQHPPEKLPEILRTHREYRAREDFIRSSVAAGETNLTLPLIHSDSKYTLYRDLRDLSVTDTADWPNSSMAKIYGVSTILGADDPQKGG